MKRYIILAAAVVMQMGLGATYSWSVYVERLRALTGLGQGLVQLPFTTFYIAFPATVIAGGVLVQRWGPRWCAMLGGALFGGGWLLASLGGRHFGFTLAGIGLMAGVGVGLAYLVPIAVGVRWFPERKGLVTGVAVAGFGGGAALISKIGDALLTGGRSPFEVFGLLGLAFLVIIPLTGWLMQNPPEPSVGSSHPNLSDQSDPSKPSDPPDAFSFRAIFARRDFRLLYAAMIVGLAAGFTVNANLKDMAPASAAATAGIGATAVALFALANALGRIIWGFAFDHSPHAATMLRLNLWSQGAVLLLALLAGRWPAGYLVIALLTGFNYGGVLVLYAATSARVWGAARLSVVYGVLFSANIPASLAPLFAGFVFDATGTFAPALILLAIALITAGFLIKALTPATHL